MDNFLGKLCDSQYNLGIKHVFDAFQEEIDENWTGDFRANAQYLVDKVKGFFEEELARAGAKNGRIVEKEN